MPMENGWACSSLKGIISDMQVIEDFESRPHKAITFVVERGKPGMASKNLPRRYLVAVEEDYQEEARKKKEGRREKKAKEANKGRGNTR